MSGKNFLSLTSPVIFCTFFSFHQEETLKNNLVRLETPLRYQIILPYVNAAQQ
jgi:hypothetical protein